LYGHSLTREAGRSTLPGFFDYWSQELFRIYGLDPAKAAPTLEEYLGIVHPQDREFMAGTIRTMLAQGSSCAVKKRIVRPDGELRYVRCVGVPVIDGGILKSIVGTAMDVTEQEQMTQELQRREAYLAEAQRLSHTGSFGWSVSSGEIFWSEETFRIFEYDRATKPSVELVLKRVHAEDVALVKQTIERASQDAKDFDFEHRLRMPDGSVKYVHVVAHALSDESVSIEFVGAVDDITAAKQAGEALRKSEEQWRNVFENNPTMYLMVDAAGTVLAVNPFGAEQLGYKIDELVGQPVLRVFHETDREAAQGNVALCLKQLGQSMTWELRKVRKDGSMLWVRETGRAILRVNDSVVLIACEDITERKYAEERMLEAQEALHQAEAELARVNRVMLVGETAASIAHEVNQPIAAVVTNARACLRWLAAQPPDVEEARRALGRIVRDGNRAGEVIARIRALVKKSPPRKDWLNVNETILEVVFLTGSEVQENRVLVQTQLSNDLPLILADRIQLQQVILNLIKNAIEAMTGVSEGSRKLLVSSGEDKSKGVLVAVRDSGPGLDPEALAHLFDAFYTTKPDGMGMGLAISRSIIEAHGGRLWATPNESHGAVFQFRLPADGDRMP
jgi:PAS domain S-box-containing protein